MTLKQIKTIAGHIIEMNYVMKKCTYCSKEVERKKNNSNTNICCFQCKLRRKKERRKD